MQFVLKTIRFNKLFFRSVYIAPWELKDDVRIVCADSDLTTEQPEIIHFQLFPDRLLLYIVYCIKPANQIGAQHCKKNLKSWNPNWLFPKT